MTEYVGRRKFWWNMDNGFWALLCAIGFIVGVGVVIGVSWYFVSHRACTDLAQQLSLPTRFNIFNGCFIKTPVGWVQQSNYLVNHPVP
jgi:hypothetical protein